MNTAFGLIRKYRLNPLRAARVLGFVAVAMHDAAVAVVAVVRAPDAAQRAALLIAGGAMLGHWFPEEPRGKWLGWAVQQAALRLDARGGAAVDVAGADDDAGVARAVIAAQQAAQAVIARSLYDRADPAGVGLRAAPTGAAVWKAAPPLWSSRPVEPAAEQWAVWLVSASIAQSVPAPLSLDAVRYAAEVDEVLAVQRALTLEQKRLADDWNLDLGTLTPAGVWVERLLRDAAFVALPWRQQTACLSLLTAALHDAFIACWAVKFKWWTERPVTAIRRERDAGFLPYLVTPSFPSYVSGHAVVSGAAAAVLGALFTHNAARFERDAQDAAVSRLYGGIHFRSDNDEGLRLGRALGAAAVSATIERTRAPGVPLAQPLIAGG